MLLVRYCDRHGTLGVGVDVDGGLFTLPAASMADLLRHSLSDLHAMVSMPGPPVDTGGRLPPVDGRTEVWASGVTYLRSRDARISESTDADVYSRVYDADRPELFLKAVAWRVVTDGEPVGIRADSRINVPEPELAVVANADGEIIGYTVCNDMSSRDIEGANPLYLPQAKMYAGSCALAPGIRPAWEMPTGPLAIRCRVYRRDHVVWDAATDTGRMARTPADLLAWLWRADTFPDGVVLTTGTGIVPALDVTLVPGDVVDIEIEHVGRLRNPVRSGRDAFTWLTDDAARVTAPEVAAGRQGDR